MSTYYDSGTVLPYRILIFSLKNFFLVTTMGKCLAQYEADTEEWSAETNGHKVLVASFEVMDLPEARYDKACFSELV